MGQLIRRQTPLADQNLQTIFAEIRDRARSLDPANARAWFDQLRPVRLNAGSLTIACPDRATAEFLAEHCKATFTLAAQQVTGHLVTIQFIADDEHTQAASSSLHSAVGLHPDYTFENFVVGPSNRLAHASCVAVSHSPGNTYNPLFIYGNSGLGKTHLLQAVCFEAYNRFPNAVIQFLSCEEFVNRFIRAIEEGDLAGFQDRFRNVDMLVIDDVQFLREREHSQEEFFHTFNALYNNGKQIILSADSAPAKIPSLEQRLISRFNWGLVARIDPPTYETRVAIVQKKAHLRGLDIPDQVAEYIAQKLQANIRELEGALTAIYAVATTTGQQITLELARAALQGHVETDSKPPNITDIIDVVTRHFDVRLADLQSKKRTQSIALPRQICMYLARKLTRHSLEEIGGHLGGRDHTTVMHACSKIDRIQQTDPQMHALIEQLSRQITQRL